MNPFIERHREKIAGELSCLDRVVMTGTLPDTGHAQAMTGYLGHGDIRLFDYARWEEPLRQEIRERAEALAAEAGVEIEFIRRHKAFRKEQRIKEIIEERGDHPGLVHLFSAMELGWRADSARRVLPLRGRTTPLSSSLTPPKPNGSSRVSMSGNSIDA